MGRKTSTINIIAGEKVRLHVRTILEKLSAHLLAERIASVDPGTQISGKREGATLSRSGYSACGTEIKRKKEK